MAAESQGLLRALAESSGANELIHGGGGCRRPADGDATSGGDEDGGGRLYERRCEQREAQQVVVAEYDSNRGEGERRRDAEQ